MGDINLEICGRETARSHRQRLAAAHPPPSCWSCQLCRTQASIQTWWYNFDTVATRVMGAYKRTVGGKPSSAWWERSSGQVKLGTVVLKVDPSTPPSLLVFGFRRWIQNWMQISSEVT